MIDRFARRNAHVAIIGLGYVGLPLALAFAEAGYHVTGIDLDARKVDAINRGASYIEDVPAARVAALVRHSEVERWGRLKKRRVNWTRVRQAAALLVDTRHVASNLAGRLPDRGAAMV